MTGRAIGRLLAVLASAAARLAAPGNSSVAKHDSPLHVASCSQRLFELLGNPSYDGFTECVDKKLNSSSHWLGPTAGAYAQCWCTWNMSAFVSAQGCEKHGNWNWLTEVQCGVNCSDGAALQCRKSCPLFCFEGGPGLPGCECRDECIKLVGCMASSKGSNASKDLPDVNSSEAPVQCEAEQMRQSKEMKAFGDCALANVTYGNRWRSLTQTYQCLCSGHLQQELHSQNCCGSSNQSRPFCEANCSVDCSTPEALQCSQQCSLMCEGAKASQECNDQCLQSTGHCNHYKVCPVATPKFSYVCDDGHAPSSNGCCKGVFDNDRCPLLCEVQWKTNAWSATPSEARCECGGCPRSLEESRKLMNETLLAVFERDATKQLIFILMTRGLNSLTPEMRGLFAMQMEAVQSEIARYDGKGLLNWKLVHSLRVISSFYFQKLSQAADAEVETLKSSAAGTGMIWFALISCLCVISTIIIGCIISKSLALQRRTQPVVTPPTDTLVVGRPISSKDPPPEDAVQGVLVAEAAASR